MIIVPNDAPVLHKVLIAKDAHRLGEPLNFQPILNNDASTKTQF